MYSGSPASVSSHSELRCFVLRVKLRRRSMLYRMDPVAHAKQKVARNFPSHWTYT